MDKDTDALAEVPSSSSSPSPNGTAGAAVPRKRVGGGVVASSATAAAAAVGTPVSLAPSSSRSGSPVDPEPMSEVEMDAVIGKLPPWIDQLGGVRNLVIGSMLGFLFAIITLKLSLGSAGIIPGLGVPAGLISFGLLKSWTGISTSLGLAHRSPRLHNLLFKPFLVQENSVMQTFILSISGVAFTGGFGTYLTGMSYQTYLNLDRDGAGLNSTAPTPPNTYYDPELSRTIPYLLMTAVLGVFMLTQMRKLMIVDWKLPFPSGTASGIMLTSFHTAAGEAEALRKVKMLGWTGLASFIFSTIKWTVSGTDYACGFGAWPFFGFKALRYSWFLDFQQNYVGAGMICPHVVNWSMLLGAILSWGIMWPLMEQKAGDWYPAGLKSHDFQGVFGYKVFLTISILMGEGMYMVCRVLLSSGKDGMKQLRKYRASKQLPVSAATPTPSSTGGRKGYARRDTDDSASSQLPLVCHAGPELEEVATGKELSGVAFKESESERRLRTRVFLGETIPWWLAPVGYGGLAVVSTIFIPMLYTPVKWYYVLVAYIVAPLFALPNSYGTGLTDWDNCSMYGKLALFIFAAWAGAEGNGVIVGLGICGVIFAATSSAATLMGDFRTGYICLTAPRAMFVAQLVGQLIGAVLAPLAFMLFWGTGKVNVPNGPYPAPFSDIYRGMALIGVKGFGALPKYCGLLMLCFFLAGMLLCLLRDILPSKYGRFVPSPMAMGIPFYIGASSAIDFWLGSVIMHIWEYINKAGASEFGTIVGAGLLVGDGLWAIPSSIVAIFGKAPPVCMGFYGPSGGCQLPYCIAFWLGGSELTPGGAVAPLAG